MKSSQYDWDDPNIPEEYYDSEEWQELLDAINEPPNHEPVYKPMRTHDDNWDKLRNEPHLPPEPELRTVKRITNCKLTVWYDSDMPSITYDVLYTDNTRVLGRHLNGEWSNEEPKKPTEATAHDALRTMLVRSGKKLKLRFTRLYPSRDVKNVQRDINLIEIHNNMPLLAYFVVADKIYPARLNENNSKGYMWSFNGQSSMTIDEFCDLCWEAV
jgi:hypothetical protein